MNYCNFVRKKKEKRWKFNLSSSLLDSIVSTIFSTTNWNFRILNYESFLSRFKTNSNWLFFFFFFYNNIIDSIFRQVSVRFLPRINKILRESSHPSIHPSIFSRGAQILIDVKNLERSSLVTKKKKKKKGTKNRCAQKFDAPLKNVTHARNSVIYEVDRVRRAEGKPMGE